MMLKLIILFVFVTTALGGYETNQIAWWDTDDNKEYSQGSTKTTPFPQCLLSGSKSKYLQSSSLQNLFDKALQDEEKSAKDEYYENYNKNNYDVMDYEANDLRRDNDQSRSAAAAAIKLTRTIMTKLACDLNGTDSNNLNNFLKKFAVPEEFCSFRETPDCDGLTGYRTPTGVCNNEVRPYDGSSHTAFARLQPADYADYISEPRRKSRRGGTLPACRKISLALGSKPVFDRKFNNFFTIFGQYIAHDIALSLPVSDTYSTPITSCTCESKYDWNKCTVIDIQSDDPYLRGQKCMAFPATAQAFKDQICSLGVKEQINGNTHFIDLSGLYGSTKPTALALRSQNGLLKTTRRSWLKYDLPPGQREGKSCIDATYKRKCFAGGDSRLMINLLFTGIQTMFLRAHNLVATAFLQINPTWSSDMIYEETRKVITAFFQKFVYVDWLPILFGQQTFSEQIGAITQQTTYDNQTSAIVFNEVASAALRCHTLVRDLFSRCTPDGKRIDQLWLNDILHKSKYAYDIENNGIDSVLCGSLYDYGFAHDANFAHQIHHRLFESTNKYGQMWRNDLIAINICRGREHGIASYNTYREFCNLTKAYYFEDFGDTINYEGIKLLKKFYKDVDDVDLFVGLNLEDTVSGGLIGPVSACLLGRQFRDLRDGDRFFFSHIGALSPNYFQQILNYSLWCFVCQTVDIDQVPLNPFEPPSDGNPLQDCTTCPQLNATTLAAWGSTGGPVAR
jgi:peroxidase